MEESNNEAPIGIPGLLVSRQVLSGEVNFILKDRVSLKYFRLGDDEYEIFKLFDGKKDYEEIACEFNNAHPGYKITPDEVEEFSGSLKSIGIVQKSPAEIDIILNEKIKSQEKKKGRLSDLLYIKLPVWDPDRFFNRIIKHIGFFFTPGFFALFVLLFISALLLISGDFERFINDLKNVYTSQTDILALLPVILFVIVAHEFAHGLTCKYYGGEVHEVGFFLIYFFPAFYCNVNDAWTFPERRKKLFVNFAGIYIELFIFSLAVFIWRFTEGGTAINTFFYKTATVSGISSILFNLNPLIKLDGYYALSDFLEIPNLWSGSYGYLRYLIEKYIFRIPVEIERIKKRKKRIFLVYGLSSGIYSVFILALTFFWVRDLVGGFGTIIIIAVLVILMVMFFKYSSSQKKIALVLCAIIIPVIASSVFIQKDQWTKGRLSICEINSLDKIMAKVLIEERDIALIREGNPVKIRLKSYEDRFFKGIVKDISISDEGCIVSVIIRNPDNNFKIGMTGTAKIYSGTYTVFNSAIRMIIRSLKLQ